MGRGGEPLLTRGTNSRRYIDRAIQQVEEGYVVRRLVSGAMTARVGALDFKMETRLR